MYLQLFSSCGTCLSKRGSQDKAFKVQGVIALLSPSVNYPFVGENIEEGIPRPYSVPFCCVLRRFGETLLFPSLLCLIFSLEKIQKRGFPDPFWSPLMTREEYGGNILAAFHHRAMFISIFDALFPSGELV